MTSGVSVFRDEWTLPQEGGSFDKVCEVLFRGQKTELYALLDGASDPNVIYNSILQSKEEFRCLYRGELDNDMTLCAPYLMRIQKPSIVALELIKAMFDNNAGILVRVVPGADIDLIRRHFRKFLLVRMPDQKVVYFRYYDPRVFREYHPTCNSTELKYIFGPLVSRYIVPTGKGFGLKVFEGKAAAVAESDSGDDRMAGLGIRQEGSLSP